MERGDAQRHALAMRFDIVFMDPPYELARTAWHRLLESAAALCGGAGVLVFELPGDMDIRSPGWQLLRRIGKSGVNEPSVCILAPA